MTKYFDFEQHTISTFTIRAETEEEARALAEEVFGNGEPVEAVVNLTRGLPITVESFRYLPRGSADASEPELVSSGTIVRPSENNHD